MPSIELGVLLYAILGAATVVKVALYGGARLLLCCDARSPVGEDRDPGVWEPGQMSWLCPGAVYCVALQKTSDSMLALAEDHRNDIISNLAAIAFGAIASQVCCTCCLLASALAPYGRMSASLMARSYAAERHGLCAPAVPAGLVGRPCGRHPDQCVHHLLLGRHPAQPGATRVSHCMLPRTVAVYACARLLVLLPAGLGV